MSRRTRNSAGWVTTYSELIESLSPIFAARAGKSLCIFVSLSTRRAIRVRNLFLRWQRRRLFGFTVQFCPECLNSFAARRRATHGWFLHIDLARCQGIANAYVSNSSLGTSPTNNVASLARCFSLANFCRCSRKRSSYAVTSLIRSSCRRCSTRF